NPRNVGAGNSFVANNLLLPNTNYFARLRSYIGVVNSDNSLVLPTSTLAPAPVANAASAVDVTTFTANWTPITGVGNAIVTYRIEVSTVSSFATILVSRDNLSTNSQIFTSADGIQAGSVYYYRVFSRNLGGVSLLSSNVISAITKPNSLPATEITSVGFKANWDIVNNASSYTIELSLNNTFSPITFTNNISGANNNNFVYNNINPGTTYFYRVRAVIGAFTSPNSNTITVTTNIATLAPNPPTALPATAIGTGSFTANWTLIANADKYFIDVSSNPSFTLPLVLDNLDVGNVNFLNITGVGAGSVFYYRVRSFNLLGTSANSNDISVLTALAPIGTPAQPTNTSIFVSSISSMDFNWKDNSDNEIGFEVQRSGAFAGPFVTVFTSPANPSSTNLNLSFTDTGLQQNTVYFYRVRALGVGGNNSNFTLPISDTTFRDAPLPPTALFAQTFSGSQIQLNWTDNSNDEDGFNIYRALLSGGTFTLAGSVAPNTTLFIDNGLVVNTSYQYIVKSVKGLNESDPTNVAFAETKDVPLPPTNLNATAANSKTINLTWIDNSNNEDHFIIQMAYLDNGNVFDFRAEVPANTVSFAIGAGTADNPFLSPNQTYRFRITAVAADGSRSIFSNIATASTPTDISIERPNAPIELRGESVSTSEISIKWKDNSNNEDYFKIERSLTVNGAFVEIARVPANTTRFSDLTVAGGATYFYRVYASNGGGDSDPASTSGIAICNVIVVVNTDLPGNGTIVCDTKKVLLTLNTNVTIQNARLQWFKNGAPIDNATLDSYKASETGEYYCRVIAGACDKKSEIKSIIINPSFNVTIVFDNGVGGSGKLETNLLGANSYQWFYEYQPILGANSDTYLPSRRGVYYLVVTNNSCSTTSNIIMVDVLPNSIESDNLNDYLSVSPNPTDGKATVKLEYNLTGKCEVSLIDMQGKSITLFKDVKDSPIFEQTFDLSSQANGLYIIEVKINDKIGRKKIIKR
ncbi:MAG: T9SS C-terminal target domain-containing protein, partial [Bacteroidetes bacterium]